MTVTFESIHFYTDPIFQYKWQIIYGETWEEWCYSTSGVTGHTQRLCLMSELQYLLSNLFFHLNRRSELSHLPHSLTGIAPILPQHVAFGMGCTNQSWPVVCSSWKREVTKKIFASLIRTMKKIFHWTFGFLLAAFCISGQSNFTNLCGTVARQLFKVLTTYIL